MNSNEKKDKGIAFVGTIVVHALAVLVLFLMAFRTPLPLPGEEGVEVSRHIVRYSVDTPTQALQPTQRQPFADIFARDTHTLRFCGGYQAIIAYCAFANLIVLAHGKLLPYKGTF